MIIDFERIGQLELFGELFSNRILLSDFTNLELTDSGLALPSATQVHLTEDEMLLYSEIRRENRGLGPGEAGALAVAILNNAVFLANDGPARSSARKRGVSVSGSLGVLTLAVEIGRIAPEQSVELVDQIVEAGAYLSLQLIDEFRQQMRQRASGAGAGQ